MISKNVRVRDVGECMIERSSDKIDMVKGKEDSIFSDKNIVDFDYYPAISMFINIYGIYPNIYRFNEKYCNIDLMNFVDAIKGKTLYSKNIDFKLNKDIQTGSDNDFVFICMFKLKNDLYYISSSDSRTCVYLLTKKDFKKSIGLLKLMFTGIPLSKDNNSDSGHINLLVSDVGGLYIKPFKIKDPNIDIDLNYNDDFKEIDQIIKTKLTESSKGIVLLQGVPGTGKTTYIRHLANHLKKRLIFVPPTITESLSDPNFVSFIMEYPDSVFIIEDGENVLMKRNGQSSQAISNILNISDGLLSDCLNIQLLVTFNTDIGNIDEALLRKGRIIAKYEFKELSKDKAKKLGETLGVEIDRPDTLANIYNKADKDFNKKVNKIGF